MQIGKNTKSFDCAIIGIAFIQLVFPNPLTWFVMVCYSIFMIGAFLLVAFLFYYFLIVKEKMSIKEIFTELKKRDMQSVDKKIMIASLIVYFLIFISFGSAGYTGLLYILSIIVMIFNLLYLAFFYKLNKS